MTKVALITGASGGLGQALAKKLLANDWQLIVVGRDGDKIQAAYGSNHLQIVADCSTVAGAKHIFEAIQASNLMPTALAHCVGNIRLGALHRMAEVDIMDCINANLMSAFHTLAGFTNFLKETKLAGSAVFVSSAAARIGTPNHEELLLRKAA